MPDAVKCNICRGKGVIKTVNGFKPCQRCAQEGVRDPTAKIDAVETQVVVGDATVTRVSYVKTEAVVDLHEGLETR